MLNLFILIILQQFETYYITEDNILEVFKGDLEKFKDRWIKFSTEYEGIRIPAIKLEEFFKDLEGNLGMSQ